MKLNELMMHLQGMMEICQKCNISPSSIEVVFVADVMRARDDTIKNCKSITSTHMDAMKGQLMLFDASSWDQYQKALK